MNKMDKKLLLLTGLLFIFLGCTGGTTQTRTGDGVTIKTEVTPSTPIPPGGSVLVRALVSNLWENTLENAMLKLARTYGDLLVNGGETIDDVNNVIVIGDIISNPNASLPGSWTISVKESAIPGSKYENSARLCFSYNQTGFNEIVMIKEPGTNVTPLGVSQNGPLSISFSGLERGFIYNEDLNIKEIIPISVNIKNNYTGYLGDITTSAQSPTKKIRKMTINIYDTDNDEDGYGDSIELIENSESPKELTCDLNYNTEIGGFQCIAEMIDEEDDNRITMFGDEVLVLLRARIINLGVDELREKVEVILEYDYCVQAEPFNIEVYDINKR